MHSVKKEIRIKAELFKCDSQVHVFIGRNRICQCGKTKQ